MGLTNSKDKESTMRIIRTTLGEDTSDKTDFNAEH